MDLTFLNAVGGVKVVAGVIAALVGLWLVSRLMKPAPPARKFQRRSCGNCGWEGEVTAFKPKCPKCANTL